MNNLTNQIFKWIFENIYENNEFQSVNYKKINNILISNESICLFQHDFSKSKFIRISFELLFNDNNNIAIFQNKWFIKNLWNSTTINNEMNYVFDELNKINISFSTELNIFKIIANPINNDDLIQCTGWVKITSI